MTDSSAPKEIDRRTPPRPEPFLDVVGRPEVTKGLFGDFFKRKGKPQAKKSEARGAA